MSGVQLSQLDASDLLDVLHYFFEEDFRYSNPDEAGYKDALRENLYRDMYQKTYKYKMLDESATREFGDISALDPAFEAEEEEPMETIKPFSPRSSEVKPYIPPTQVDPDGYKPFGDVLDSPFN